MGGQLEWNYSGRGRALMKLQIRGVSEAGDERKSDAR